MAWHLGNTIPPYPWGRVFTFTNDCLQHLSSLPIIQEVDLSGIEVSDAGLVHLARLKSRNAVLLKNTKVTDEGVPDFRKNSPTAALFDNSDSWIDPG
jgi:hypothetical protein